MEGTKRPADDAVCHDACIKELHCNLYSGGLLRQGHNGWTDCELDSQLVVAGPTASLACICPTKHVRMILMKYGTVSNNRTNTGTTLLVGAM